MTVRELIAAARLNGFEHIVYSVDQRREHVWRSPDWRVSYERWEDTAGVLLVHERRRGLSRSWERQRAEVVVSSADEIHGVLSALGVLPSPTGAAA